MGHRVIERGKPIAQGAERSMRATGNPGPTEIHEEVGREVEQPASRLLDRLIFLRDGGFAIAMTLLLVELTVPQIAASGPTEDLTPLLWALGAKYISCPISFLVIASYWTSHQRIFRYIIRADNTLVWLNVLLLLCIAFQPLPTSVLGAYRTTTSVAFYAGTLCVTGVIVLALWVYAISGHRLVRPNLSRRFDCPPHMAGGQRTTGVSGVDRPRPGQSDGRRIMLAGNRRSGGCAALGVPGDDLSVAAFGLTRLRGTVVH